MAAVVACLTWVPRGAAKENPDKVELSPEDLERLIAATKGDLDALDEDNSEFGDEFSDVDDEGVDAAALAEAQAEAEAMVSSGGEHDDASEAADAAKGKKKTTTKKKKNKDTKTKKPTKEPESAAAAAADDDDDDELAEYNLDAYDDDEEDEAAQGAAGLNFGGLTYYASNAEDPYITLHDEDDDEADDFRIKPSDNLVVAGMSEEECSHVEVFVYDEAEDQLFSHHDNMLSSFAICVEWLDFDPEDPEQPGNLLAVGSMSPQIEVWDLDIIDAAEPAFVLGDTKAAKKKAKKAKKDKKTKKSTSSDTADDTDGHSAEVMVLAWNRAARHLLASGAADHTVKLWDLRTRTCLRTFRHHAGKVQCVAWNPQETAVLLTGSYDHTAAVFDTRRPEHVARWRFAADVESLAWNPASPHLFLAGTEDGHVFCCDARRPGETVFRLSAHDASVTALALTPLCPGLLVTASVDKTAKVWDVHGDQPAFVVSRELPQGPLFAAAISPDEALTIAVGGQLGGVRTYDLGEIPAVKRRFETRVLQGPRPVDRQPRLTEEERLAEQQAQAEAELEDADLADDDEEGWADILRKMSINPSVATMSADERAARKLEKKKKRAPRPPKAEKLAARAAKASAAGKGDDA